jgi:DNA-binding GntR family transcriptional regulator
MTKNQARAEQALAIEKRRSAPLPAHETVYRKLREVILFGELTPGQPVTIQGLVDMLGAGMTPVREAIRRLTAEGALEFQGNRRVCVPQLSPGNVDELVYARQAIEPQLALRAAKRADPASHKRLAAIDAQLDEAIVHGDVRAYLELNYRFHSEIYNMAHAPILRALADGLWLRFGPSLRVVCGRIGTKNLPDQHREALIAMQSGDAEAAAEAMRKDVIQGMEQVRDALIE